jgi:hypothetical protein
MVIQSGGWRTLKLLAKARKRTQMTQQYENASGHLYRLLRPLYILPLPFVSVFARHSMLFVMALAYASSDSASTLLD